MELPAMMLFVLAVARLTTALEVTPGSRCAVECLDSPGGNEFSAADSTTTVDDISCRDVDYSTTDAGIKFSKCLDCLQHSKKVDRAESDLKWYIYNLRYTLSTCMYGAPKTVKNGTVAAQCNIDRACKPIKEPLMEPGFDANPNTTWEYCTASNGAFMGPHLSPCISCLQATDGEVYLSNFLVALEAGCKQAPDDGALLSLSGSVFTTSPVNMTDPPAQEQGSPSSGSLPPSAIAGIVIGVLLVFLLAAALLIVHFRRQRSWNEWEQSCYYSNFAQPAAYPDQAMSQAYRRYYTGNAFSEKPPPAQPSSSGDYYDRLEAEQAASAPGQNNQANPAPRSHTPETDTQAATPSPPADTHTHRPSNTPDSFAVQAYLNAAQDSARLATRKPAEPQTKRASSAFSTPYTPYMPKLRIPKIFVGGRASKNAREMQISPPIMTLDARFRDIPMTAPVAASRDRAPPPPPLASVSRQDDYIEVPLRSGKSTLYGY